MRQETNIELEGRGECDFDLHDVEELDASKLNEYLTSISVSSTGQRAAAGKIHYRGYIYAILAALFLSISQVFIKKTQIINSTEQALLRYVVQALSMFVIIRWLKLPILAEKKLMKILIFRSALGVCALLAYYYSVKFINPSDTIALSHCNIIFVTLLGRIFLGEKLNLTHLISIFLTIAGWTILIIQTFKSI